MSQTVREANTFACHAFIRLYIRFAPLENEPDVVGTMGVGTPCKLLNLHAKTITSQQDIKR